MGLEKVKKAGKIVVGTRQTAKMIENNSAREVYLARDAEERIVLPIIQACKEKGLPVYYVETMAELGKACQIKVGAAMCAILEK
ncbi:K-turn RNA binding protein; alternative ribosomal protein L7A [anaerobic digester metagenome]|uniref:K-turn RNA binding protein alternative ribosomal protein L7A n=1 Tax=anaerobic digester metagenome TaxID=1263854 RepID=A0A485LZC5_9ZZZZ